ncbi:MAG: metal ABC transporter ATP-binding protein [Anaerolineae bacterium]
MPQASSTLSHRPRPRLFTHPVSHEAGRPIIELEHVSVLFNGQPPALEDVSLVLESGQQVAVVGPNGAGKSTLFRVIAGVQRPTSGAVRVYGHEPAGHICIAFVPQRSQVDWAFPVTVFDTVMMGRTGRLGLFRRPGRRDREIVEESLRLVNMADMADRQIGELSGGQQQRVFIARALAQEAELLLMDEPFTGLDAPSQELLLDIMAQMQQRGVTILVATHDLNQASHHFDQLILLNRRLIAVGPGREVLTPANLRRAYGDQIAMIDIAEGLLVVPDTCCGHDE